MPTLIKDHLNWRPRNHGKLVRKINVMKTVLEFIMLFTSS